MPKVTGNPLQGFELERITENANEFSLELMALSLAISEGYEILVTEVIKDLFLTLVERNPYLTGFSKMQWHICSGEPPNEDDQVKPEDWEKIDSDWVYDIKYSEAENFSVKSLGDEIYIYNNCEYIQKLEEGHSKQAKKGFIHLTLAEFNSRLVEKAEELGIFS